MDKLLKSAVNFQRVRDGRNALPFYFDLDLSSARSVAAGTHFIANVAGDSFYADANPVDGNCVVHFQDTNLDRAAVPFYVSPGFIANVPFTQLLFENTAQPGKKIRIAYGVDIDFQPGSVAQIALTIGATSLQRYPYYDEYSSAYGSIALAVANTPETIVAPASNTNGIIVWSGNFKASSGTVTHTAAFLAKSGVAPTTVVDGDTIIAETYNANTNSISGPFGGVLNRPIRIAAGKGLYYISNVTETYSRRSLLYTIQ